MSRRSFESDDLSSEDFQSKKSVSDADLSYSDKTTPYL